MTATVFLIVLAILSAAYVAIVESGTRFDRDLPLLMDDPDRKATDCEIHGHAGPLSRYANYGIWLCCGSREDRVYDQDLDGTDLDKWNQEMTS